MFDLLLGKTTMRYIFLIVVVICILTLFIALIKYDKKHTVFKSIGFVILTIVTIFSGVNSYKYLSATSSIYGQYLTTPTVSSNSNGDFSLNLKNVLMTPGSNENEYRAEFELNQNLTINSDEKYSCFINDLPCSISTYSQSYLVAMYQYVFYNDDFEMILTDTLYFKIFIFKNSTNIIISTYGGENAVNCWNAYFNKFDFIFSVKINKGVYVEKDTHNIELIVNDEVYDTIQVLDGHDFIPPEAIETDDYFVGWKINNVEILVVKHVDSDITLYADIIKYDSQRLYSCQFYNYENTLVHAEYIADDKLTYADPKYAELPNNYIFNGWQITGMSADIDHYASNNAISFNEFTGSTASFSKDKLYFKNLCNENRIVVFKPLYTNYNYNIEFENIDENFEYEIFMKNEENVVKISKPERIGYIFNYWKVQFSDEELIHQIIPLDYLGQIANDFVKTYEGSSFTIKSEDAYCLSNEVWILNLAKEGASVKLIAYWKPIEFTVQFENCDQSEFPNQTLKYYDSLIITSNPQKTGYVFDGWQITGMDNNEHWFVVGENETEFINGESFKTTKKYIEFAYLTTVNNSVVTFTACWKEV